MDNVFSTFNVGVGICIFSGVIFIASMYGAFPKFIPTVYTLLCKIPSVFKKKIVSAKSFLVKYTFRFTNRGEVLRH